MPANQHRADLEELQPLQVADVLAVRALLVAPLLGLKGERELAHDGRGCGHAGVDGSGVLAADAVVLEEEPRLDAQAPRVFDRLERLPYRRDRPDVRPDDRREALLLKRLGECAGLDDIGVAEKVGAFGLRASMKVVIAVSSSRTFLKAPLLMALSVISAKKRSTRFAHEAEVGVKCIWTRGCASSHAFTAGCLWVA